VTSIGIYLVVFGVCLATISLLGCFGACCEQKSLLLTFAVLLLAVVFTEIAVIVVASLWPKRLRNSANEGMVKTLNESFSTDLTFVGENITLSENRIELAWATLQFSLQCCGGHNSGDYSQISWDRSYNSTVINITDAQVPASCCKRHSTATLPISTNIKDFIDLKGCLATGDADSTNTVGCYHGVLEVVDKYVSVVIGIAAAVGVVELLQIQFAVCLCIYVTVRESLDWAPYKRIKP